MLGMRLRKQDAPAYKCVDIEFPASEFELQEKLDSIGVGISPEKKCFVSSFTGMIGVFGFLVNQFVNADEVQFLAKRMDSFDKNELNTFYAAASVEQPKTVADLINLTFNTHCYTAVSDFSDIEKIGRDYELGRQGCMSMTEFEQLDFAAIGHELIASGKGEVTPFGVLYRNGNTPEEPYNGKQFPEYHYRDEVATVTLEFEGATEYLYLPCAEVEIEKAANRLVLPDPAPCDTTLEWHNMNEAIYRIFTEDYPLSGHLYNLNELSRCYMGFDEAAQSAFHSIVELAQPESLQDVVTLAQNLYEFSAIPDIQTAEEYGRHVAKQGCELNWNIDKYIDFKRFGEDLTTKENGEFTEWGYIGYRGDTPAVQELLHADRQEQVQGMRMEM